MEEEEEKKKEEEEVEKKRGGRGGGGGRVIRCIYRPSTAPGESDVLIVFISLQTPYECNQLTCCGSGYIYSYVIMTS